MARVSVPGESDTGSSAGGNPLLRDASQRLPCPEYAALTFRLTNAQGSYATDSQSTVLQHPLHGGTVQFAAGLHIQFAFDRLPVRFHGVIAAV